MSADQAFMGLNVSYRHFGKQAAAAEDARRGCGGVGGRTGHMRATVTAT